MQESKPKRVKLIVSNTPEVSTFSNYNISEFDSYHQDFSDLNNHVINKAERTIMPDLTNIPIPDNMKFKADAIFNKMTPQVRRAKVRVQLVFYCTYCAYLEARHEQQTSGKYYGDEISVVPEQLGHLFGLTPAQVRKCQSVFSPAKTGYKPPASKISPLSLLPIYGANLNLSKDYIDMALETSKIVLAKEPNLLEENPQTVAMGLLYYSNVINGISLEDPLKLAEISTRSKVTIEAMYRRINEIDNK
jgi:hypothetical protein